MLRSLFIDFNSYFASVEQQLNPALRERPVGVVPVMADSSCCIAASTEAMAFGVKTCTRVSEAKRLCPGMALARQIKAALLAEVGECMRERQNKTTKPTATGPA